MRILSVTLESVVPIGHPAYKKDVETRSFEKSSELHIEDALLAHECFDQLDSLLDLSYLADLVADANEDPAAKALADFDQASYDKEMTEAMSLPVSEIPRYQLQIRLVERAGTGFSVLLEDHLSAEDRKLAVAMYEQLDGGFDEDHLRYLMEINESETDAQLALKAKGFSAISGKASS